MNPDIALETSPAARPAGRPAQRPAWNALACVTLLFAAMLAYSNSLSGPFIFDDTSFVNQPSAKHFRPIRTILAGPRPVVQATLALNYFLGGPGGPFEKGYHVFNVIVHLLATLALFGVLRRTLLLPRLAGRFKDETATALAFCAALLWTLHPLQTEAVTYVIQRGESLMALFYLLTLYCFIRAAASGRAEAWYAASGLSCVLGMGCKEVMVSAPLAVLFYDRIFVTGSFRETLRRRWIFYLGLAATWVILEPSIREAVRPNAASAGFGFQSVTPIQYAQTECGVLLRYVGLVFLPIGQCLDYDWPIAHKASEIVPGAIGVGVLLAATVWALIRRPMWGFAGALFFMVLAPTSSVMPIKDAAFEHRMYLPLASWTAVIVVGAYLAGGRLHGRLKKSGQSRERLGRWIALAAMLLAAAALGWLTHRRNALYQSGVAIWQDTADHAPMNGRAWNNLADAWLVAGEYKDVLSYCNKAIELKGTLPEAYNNRALVYLHENRLDDALADYTTAIALRHNFPMAFNNRAATYYRLGRYDEAIEDCLEAVSLRPDFPMALYNLGNSYTLKKDYAAAIEAYRKAVAFQPDYGEVWLYLGRAYEQDGQPEEAMRCFDKAIHHRPSLIEAYQSRAQGFYRTGQYDKAWADVKAIERLGGQPEAEFLKLLTPAAPRPSAPPPAAGN